LLRYPRLRDPRVLFAAAAMAAACSSGTRPDISEAGVSNLCRKEICTPDTNPAAVCQHTCTPDPGPRLVDCAEAEAAYEFGLPLWRFEASSIESNTNARGMYSYTDNSTLIKTFRQPSSRRQGEFEPKTFEPPTTVMPRCSDEPNVNPSNHVVHIQGGPFLSWGGGVGLGMKNYPTVTGTVRIVEDAMIDVSEWEGISFWARRGPDSQVGFRVLIGDKYTDDDISYIMYSNDPTAPRFCERVRECACLNHKTCAPVDLLRADTNAGPGTGQITNELIPEACRPDPLHLLDHQTMMFCGQPEVISGLESSTQGGSTCNTCVETKCDERWPAFPDDYATADGMMASGIPLGSDRQFFGKPCSPYTMRNGIFSYWCFDPAAGERPAETTEQCGDHWTRVVNLSNEWQFYTVPFNSMAQQGWAKRSVGLDLTSVSVVRFTWDGGWIDYWIDDVRFYKRKPPAP
jgi:hypothetical protein